MAKGIIYVMSCVVDGLIKIGKCTAGSFEQQMQNLEKNGYRNVTGLKREFAISVEDFEDKSAMLGAIFEKSRVGDTDLFALDLDVAMQLLASFDGNVVYPVTETKTQLFQRVTDNRESKKIPNGKYFFEKLKKSDDKTVKARVMIENGYWTLCAGSILGIAEDKGVSQKAKEARALLQMDSKGKLLEDFFLGVCTPSHAGVVVMNQSINGWMDWKNEAGLPVDIYRHRENAES